MANFEPVPLYGVFTTYRSVTALGMVGDVRAVNSLLATLDDAEWSVRKAAVMALDALGDGNLASPFWIY